MFTIIVLVSADTYYGSDHSSDERNRNHWIHNYLIIDYFLNDNDISTSRPRSQRWLSKELS